MKLYLTLIIITFSCFTSYAQIKIELTKINQNGNLFDVIVTSYNQPVDAQLVWNHYNTDLSTSESFLVESGDTIFSMPVSEGVTMYGSVAQVGAGNILAHMSLVGTNYTFQTNYISPSTPISYDGVFEITFDSPNFQLGYPIIGSYRESILTTWPNITQRPLLTTDSITYRLEGFGPGLVTIDFGHFIRFFVGEPDFPGCNNLLEYDLSWADPSSGCNGLLDITPTNAVGPLDYTWNVASMPNVSNSQTLCQGYYEIMVVDSVSNCFLMQAVLINPDDPYIINDPGSEAILLDTVEYIYHNCEFDFSQPIDSIHYFETIDTISYTNHYVIFTLSVYSNGSVFNTEGGFFTPDYHNMILEVYIYCISVDDPIFEARKVMINTQQTLFLQNNPNTTSTIDVDVCGDYIAPDNTVYSTSGQYLVTIPNAAGTDSLITINYTNNDIQVTVSVSGITLTANAVNGSTYQWIDCANSNPVAGATNQTFTPTANGSYAVQVDNATCSTTSSCSSITTIGLQENESMADIHVFPNPVSTNLTISNTGLKNLTLEVYDNAGKLMLTTHSSEAVILLNMEQLVSGIYLVKAISTEGQQTYRIMRD